ncbi:MAG: hypothetical protein J07HN6_02501 [Halonotius sp. J07HN6]|nr:MAG: hypothetical protein J07HN6_02501 [Halonotius sp. J07HN6]
MRDDQTSQNGIGRRQALTGVGLGAIGLLSGCSTLPAFGQRIRYGTVDQPSQSDPFYREWLPEPQGYPLSATHIEYVEPSNRGQSLFGAPYGGHYTKRNIDYIGMDFDEFDWFLCANGHTVGSVDVDADKVSQTISKTSYEQFDEYNGYDIYKRDDMRRTVGIGAERIIYSGFGSDPIDEIKRFIDVGAGRVQRWHEANEDLARIIDAAGAAPVTHVGGTRSEINGQQADLEGLTINTDESHVYPRWLLLFPDDVNITRSEIENHIAKSASALDPTRIDIEQTGQLVSLLAKIRPEEFRTISGGNPFNYMAIGQSGNVYQREFITWGFSHDAENDVVTVKHEAGDSISASRLTLYIVDTTAKDAEERYTEAPEQFADTYEVVQPGDTRQVEVNTTENWQINIAAEAKESVAGWTEISYVPPSRVTD